MSDIHGRICRASSCVVTLKLGVGVTHGSPFEDEVKQASS
jgi:hypothetical protein